MLSISKVQLLLCPARHALSAARCLSTGHSFSKAQTISQQHIDTFVQLTGDSNPIHSAPGQSTDLQAPGGTAGSTADSTQTVVPGMLMASMFPAIIGSRFPGALYLSQTLKFRRSAAVGTSVLATVTVAKQSGSRVTFNTVCQDEHGCVLVDGTALALISLAEDRKQGVSTAAQQPEQG